MKNLALRLVGSLTFRCVMCVILYAGVMSLLLSAAQRHSQRMMSDASIDMNMLTERTDILENDRFGELAGMLSNNNEAIVFDAKGSCLYASTNDIAEQIHFDDLFIIASADDGDTFFQVFKREESEQGAAAYEIMLCAYDGDTGMTSRLGSCLCDQDLRIVKGDLFAPRKSLTRREFSLVTGNYQANRTIEKHEYRTVEGRRRTIVLVSPKITDETFLRLVEESQRIWIPVVSLAAAVTLVAVCIMFLAIKKTVEPLGEAIEARREGALEETLPSKIPVELQETYLVFVDLMEGLEKAREESQTLIADISHDLKTPLAVIGGYARALEDGKVPPERQEACLHAIYGKSQEANELLDVLFSLARLNHPAFSPNLVQVDLCEEVRRSAIAGSPQIERAGDSLRVDIDDAVIAVMADRQLFGRVMDNLISNACKHNSAGTTILVSCHEREGLARVVVADSGLGFPRDLRDRAFEPFVTKNRARESDKGTGLGLAIAKRGIEVMGGSIYLGDCPVAPFTTEVIIDLPLAVRSPEACDHKESF